MTVRVKKQIVFLGYSNSFSYHNIGGTDSVIRRITDKLLADGYNVVYLLYGIESKSDIEPVDGLTLICRKDLSSALAFVSEFCSDVVTVYLRKSDRLKYLLFRRKNKSIKFHQFLFTWPENCLKRFAMLADSVIYPLSGTSFCVSPRLYHFAKKLNLRAELLLPPVPCSYFVKPSDKNVDGNIKVAFLGRIDAGKGVMAAFNLLKRLSGIGGYECVISGFSWLFKRDTVVIHQQLLEQRDIEYIPVEYGKWSPQVCDSLKKMLRDIDILILPYSQLSSTIDMPLLLLEAMASLCVVITPDLGSMYEVYGKSVFCIGSVWDEDRVFNIINNNLESISSERDRLYARANEIVFDIDGVYEQFRQCFI